MNIQRLYVPLEVERKKVQNVELLLKELVSQGWRMDGRVTLMTALPLIPIKIEVLSREIK